MLSEGYDLLRNLVETGFDIPIDHRDVKRPGKNPGYRVGLGNDGLAQVVEELDRESMGRLWYHRKGKQNAFPVVRIQHALLSVPTDDPLRKRLDSLKGPNGLNGSNCFVKQLTSGGYNFPSTMRKHGNVYERRRANGWTSFLKQMRVTLPCL